MTSSPAIEPPITPPVGAGPERPVRHPLHGLLVALLIAVTAVALAVVTLAAIVWVRTQPAVTPTGPDVNLSASVKVINGAAAAASLLLPQSTEAATVTPDVSKIWQATVRFGETIRLDVLLTAQGQDEYTGAPGAATCTLTRSDGTKLRTATVSVQNATASCSWTNDGKG
jgi:hypothetical protein